MPVAALDGATMGTMWRVLYAAPPGDDPAATRAAIERRLAGLVGEMSHWDDASVLSAFNRSEPGRWTDLPLDFAQVIDTALRVAHLSGGAFDPAMGRLVDLWGFGPAGARPRPGDDAIDTVLTAGNWRQLRWDAPRLRQPGGLALDLSGIAKGYAVDAVADLLGARGVRHCLVEVGGELVGRGMRPDGDPWWVDLELPPGIALPPLRVALHQLAVATGGSYLRGAHSLDPRTGRPPDNDVVSVSVIAASAMLADALATAITILFPDLDALASLDPAARIVRVGPDGGVDEVLTPALRRLM